MPRAEPPPRHERSLRRLFVPLCAVALAGALFRLAWAVADGPRTHLDGLLSVAGWLHLAALVGLGAVAVGLADSSHSRSRPSNRSVTAGRRRGVRYAGFALLAFLAAGLPLRSWGTIGVAANYLLDYARLASLFALLMSVVERRPRVTLHELLVAAGLLAEALTLPMRDMPPESADWRVIGIGRAIAYTTVLYAAFFVAMPEGREPLSTRPSTVVTGTDHGRRAPIAALAPLVAGVVLQLVVIVLRVTLPASPAWLAYLLLGAAQVPTIVGARRLRRLRAAGAAPGLATSALAVASTTLALALVAALGVALADARRERAFTDTWLHLTTAGCLAQGFAVAALGATARWLGVLGLARRGHLTCGVLVATTLAVGIGAIVGAAWPWSAWVDIAAVLTVTLALLGTWLVATPPLARWPSLHDAPSADAPSPAARGSEAR